MERGSERTPVGKLNKRSFRYTRIWYTFWLVNFDRFCQHSSITDADEIYDMAAVRDLFTGNASNAVFKSKQYAKRFPQVKCLREEQKDYTIIWPMKVSLPSHQFLKELNLPTLSTSIVSDEWRSRRRLQGHGGLSSSRGHNERSSWTVEYNRSRSKRQWYRLRSREEPESARLCVKICKYGSWHPRIILPFCFWYTRPFAL